MATKHPDIQDKKYLDIGFGDIIAHSFGLLAPPIIIYHLADVPGPAFIIVWLLMLIASFIVLKLDSKLRIYKALAQSTLISCIAVFMFVIAAGLVLRRILPPLCC